MKVLELPDEITNLIKHIQASLISDNVATILLKLWNGERLTRTENSLDITPSELAAIWSITNRTPIKVEHTRQVKREGRIQPSKEWGTGFGYRCQYKVRDVKDIKVSHEKGRPAGSKNKKKPATLAALT